MHWPYPTLPSVGPAHQMTTESMFCKTQVFQVLKRPSMAGQKFIAATLAGGPNCGTLRRVTSAPGGRQHCMIGHVPGNNTGRGLPHPSLPTPNTICNPLHGFWQLPQNRLIIASLQGL